MRETKLVRNKFNDCVQPLICGPVDRPIVIGYVPEVNGPGAEEIAAFVPTRHELVQIVKYWERIWIENEFFMYWTSQTGSSEMRLSAFAGVRVNRIAEVLGDAEVKAAINEVWEEFGKTPQALDGVWDYFRRGLPLPEKVAAKLACCESITDEDWKDGDSKGEL